MAALRAGDVVLTRQGRTTRVLSVETRREAVPVYNIEVAGLHSYAVGDRGLLVHNAENYTNSVEKVAKEVADNTLPPKVHGAPAGTPPATKATPQKIEEAVPVAGITSPTTKGSKTPWQQFTAATAKIFRRKPHLPKGGAWKTGVDVNSPPGVPGESYWHWVDPNFPPVKYEKQFPVLEPIHGVEVRIPLVGRIDEKLDFRNANAVLGEMLKNDAALRQQFGITEQFVKDNLLHKNGNVNGRAVANWLDGQDLVWHHHQDMRRLQLVKNPPHDPDVLRHTGGEAYIRGTIDELIKRGVIKAEQSRDGLTEALIQKARELGIIPSDFPW